MNGRGACFWTLMLAVGAWAQSPEETFVRALRERRLDGLLEAYCREQIAQHPEHDVAPALAVELALSLATRASEEIDDVRRAELWKSADEVLNRALHQATDPLLKFRLTLQQSQLALAEGEWLRQWDELQGQVDQAPSAVARLEDAVKEARTLRETVATTIATNDSVTSGQKETDRQQRELLIRITNHLGIAELTLGLSLPIDDPKRITHLQSAVETVQQLAGNIPDSGDANQAAQTLVVALRNLGRTKDAWPILRTMEKAKLSTEQAELWSKEKIELMLTEGQVLDALALLHERRKTTSAVDPEWELLYLKVLLQQAGRMPSDPASVGKLQASALRQLRVLEGCDDPIWLRRGEALLGRHARFLLLESSSEYRQAGEILSRSGDHAQAARVYREAATKARAKDDVDNALALYEESARSYERGGHYELARDTFAEAAQTWPDYATAPESLLRAAINARRAFLANPSSENYDRLHSLLDEHKSRYPNTDSAADVHFIEATLQKAERHYEEAIAEFLKIPSTHRLYIPSRLGASRVYEAWKKPLEIGATSDATLGKIIGFHEALVSSLAASTSTLTMDQRAELTIRLAKFLLDARVDRPEQAEQVLTSLLSEQGVSHSWIERARRYLLFTLVRQGKYLDAERLAEAHSQSPAEEVLATVMLLHRWADTTSELQRKYIGRVQARLVGIVRQSLDRLSEEDQIAWELALGRIELHLGNDQQLAAVIERLTLLKAKRPTDTEITELIGLCYMRSQRYESALLVWRDLVRGLPEASPAWYRAKLNLVTCLRRSGNATQARKTLEMLEVIHPDLGGPELRPRFEAERELLLAGS